MKILALVPARGGSKRLPRKNVRRLGGKPLIVWSIDSALGLDDVSDVLVSTDDLEISDIAQRAGAMVPWLRPPELASDTATTLDVALHALDWYECQRGPVDGLLLLQPTSPFRSQEMLRRGLSLFAQSPSAAVIGVVPALTHPLWALKVEAGTLVPFIGGGGLRTRSQDLPEAFAVTGSFYLIPPDTLRREGTFFPTHSVPLLQSMRESTDIDTQEDFEHAEAILAMGAH